MKRNYPYFETVKTAKGKTRNRADKSVHSKNNDKVTVFRKRIYEVAVTVGVVSTRMILFSSDLDTRYRRGCWWKCPVQQMTHHLQNKQQPINKKIE